jgi:hypothetical protein
MVWESPPLRATFRGLQMTKDVASSVRIILPKKQTVDPKELARETGTEQRHRKLPPEPGRADRPTFVPDDEVLPRPPAPRCK